MLRHASHDEASLSRSVVIQLEPHLVLFIFIMTMFTLQHCTVHTIMTAKADNNTQRISHW